VQPEQIFDAVSVTDWPGHKSVEPPAAITGETGREVDVTATAFDWPPCPQELEKVAV
jgi:hypothetical protein